MFRYHHRYKGQSGLELIASVILVLLVFSMVFMKIMDTSINQGKNEGFNKAKLLSKKIAYYLDIVYEEGPGFKINLTIPSDLNGYSYDVNVSTNYVFVSILDTTFASKIHAWNITNGELRKGMKNELYNDEGRVYVRYY